MPTSFGSILKLLGGKKSQPKENPQPKNEFELQNVSKEAGQPVSEAKPESIPPVGASPAVKEPVLSYDRNKIDFTSRGTSVPIKITTEFLGYLKKIEPDQPIDLEGFNGYQFYKAKKDVNERGAVTMSPGSDTSGIVIKYDGKEAFACNNQEADREFVHQEMRNFFLESNLNSMCKKLDNESLPGRTPASGMKP